MAETKTTEPDENEPLDLKAVRKEAEAKLDPAWVKQYGEEAWKAALTVLGEPTE